MTEPQVEPMKPHDFKYPPDNCMFCAICSRERNHPIHNLPGPSAAPEVPYGPTGKRVTYFGVPSHPLNPAAVEPSVEQRAQELVEEYGLVTYELAKRTILAEDRVKEKKSIDWRTIANQYAEELQAMEQQRDALLKENKEWEQSLSSALQEISRLKDERHKLEQQRDALQDILFRLYQDGAIVEEEEPAVRAILGLTSSGEQDASLHKP